MAKIKVLDKNVSNMIAAGEVVERPASCVKELLENAVDAGATAITVEIKNGGISYIRVADNGAGMTAEDASLSFIRHATSKIGKAEDLDAIHTLGFRGEALASIAAVSVTEIYTKTEEDSVGTHIVNETGEITLVDEAGCQKGTTVIVRDLFCSVPARMKFLKKDYTEAGYIEDMINRLSLARPDISFKLINNEKMGLFTSGDNNLKNCVFSVYGEEISDNMIESEYTENSVTVSGLVGRASISRPNRNMQSFFINGRYVKSPLLARAVEEAYKDEIMVGKFPVCVLNVRINPQMVDINVHPTKLEAKFTDEKLIYHVTYWAVKNALSKGYKIPEVTVREKTEPRSIEKMREPVMTMRMPVPKSSEANVPRLIIDRIIPKTEPDTETKNQEEKISVGVKQAEEKQAEIKPVEIKEELTLEKRKDEPFKICGQVFDTYIIVEKGGEMLLVDQHAAHERLRYEALAAELEQKKISSQIMLVPCVVELTAVEMSAYIENRQILNELGFETEPFGSSSMVVRATPEELPENELKDLILLILGDLMDKRQNLQLDLMRKILYRISCKGAIKANHRLDMREMEALLNNIFSIENINTCPHGRPVTIAFKKEFIEKQFKRIV